MYTVDDRTNLTYKYNDEKFALALDAYTSDKNSVSLALRNDSTTLKIVRNLVPLLDRKAMNEFLELWAECDFSDIYDYFFYKREETGELYIIFAFYECIGELTFYDFEVDEYSATFHRWKSRNASKYVMVKA